MPELLKTSLAADDWDQHWSNFAEASDYSPAVSYRRRLLRRLLAISRSEPDRKLIELGCGTGQFAAEFCPEFPSVEFLGVDISEAGIRKARKRVPSAQFEVCDLLKPVPEPTIQSFGATDAICSEVLEHVEEPIRILVNATSAMAPGCRLVVTVPGGPMNAFDKHIGHRRHYRPEDLGALLKAAGYRVEKTLATGFPFYNLYRLALLATGSSVINIAAGPPSPAVRVSYHIFNALCKFTLDRWGWQTVAIARWPRA